MPNDKEEVHWIRSVHGTKEPWLFDHLCGFDDSGQIGIAGKVIKNAKGHDAQALLRCEISVWYPDIFEIPSRVIADLHIRRDESISVPLRELVECLISHLCHIELMVTDRQNIVIYLLEYPVGNDAIGSGSIRKA
jgi:hypothetical protein